jgi:hypothetical protein
LERGGVLLPMYQSEALWVNFDSGYIPERQVSYPFAVKIATGKISAITGKPWRDGLGRRPRQNYVVIPKQPWLDGYCVGKGVIRQFVAMPLGQGYSVEEQVTGEAEFGGIQLEVFPVKKAVFEKRFPIKKIPPLQDRRLFMARACACEIPEEMGLAPGGRMRQHIYRDRYPIDDWDTEHTSRCFVHLVNSLGWKQITGQRPPQEPIKAETYTSAGLPWFDYYDADAKALGGSSILGGLKSVLEKSREKRENPLPDNTSLCPSNIVHLRAGLRKDQVREASCN